jgi:hypothetical protein
MIPIKVGVASSTPRRADNDQESGLGLALRPTGPVVVGRIRSTPASVFPPPQSSSLSKEVNELKKMNESESSMLNDIDARMKRTAPSLPHGVYPHNTYRQAAAVNPAARPVQEAPLTYLEAFGAELSTATSVQVHESRIYQPDYTPDEICSNIKLILRTVEPRQHMLDFPLRDIPHNARIHGLIWCSTLGMLNGKSTPVP